MARNKMKTILGRLKASPAANSPQVAPAAAANKKSNKWKGVQVRNQRPPLWRLCSP